MEGVEGKASSRYIIIAVESKILNESSAVEWIRAGTSIRGFADKKAEFGWPDPRSLGVSFVKGRPLKRRAMRIFWA